MRKRERGGERKREREREREREKEREKVRIEGETNRLESCFSFFSVKFCNKCQLGCFVTNQLRKMGPKNGN